MLGSRALTPEEISTIRSNFKQIASLPVAHRTEAVFVLCLACGLRESEAISVKVGDIWNHGIFSGGLYLRRKETKGKKHGARIPINPEAAAVLQSWVQYAGLDVNNPTLPLFPASLSSCSPVPKWDYSRHTQRNAYQKVFHRCVAALGLTGRVTTHSARKTFGMAVYKATGHNPLAAKLALRHSSLASTMHYLSIGEDEVQQAILGISFGVGQPEKSS